MVKKLFLLISPLVIFLAFISSCTCYQSEAGTKEEIVGTYKLEKIEKKDDDDEPYDYKGTIEAVAYFTVDADGYGYYVYKDKNTPNATFSYIYSTFIADDEDETLFKAIEMSDLVTHKYLWEKEVGCLDEPKMGFDRVNKTLSYTIPHQDPNSLVTHEIMYQYVEYKKISDTASLDIINEELNTSFENNRPFIMAKLKGLAVASFNDGSINNPSKSIYDYIIIDYDSINTTTNKITCYYALKQNHTKTSISADISIKVGNNNVKYIELSLLDITFTSSTSSTLNVYYPTYFGYESWTEPDLQGTKTLEYSIYFNNSIYTNVDELIASLNINS